MHWRLKKAVLNFPRELPKITLPLTFLPKLSEFSDEDYLCCETGVHILGGTKVWLENSDSKMAGKEEGFVTIAQRCLIVLLMSHMSTPRI